MVMFAALAPVDVAAIVSAHCVLGEVHHMPAAATGKERFGSGDDSFRAGVNFSREHSRNFQFVTCGFHSGLGPGRHWQKPPP